MRVYSLSSYRSGGQAILLCWVQICSVPCTSTNSYAGASRLFVEEGMPAERMEVPQSKSSITRLQTSDGSTVFRDRSCVQVKPPPKRRNLKTTTTYTLMAPCRTSGTGVFVSTGIQLTGRTSLAIIRPEIMERLALSDQELAGRQGETRLKARMVILCGELSFWNTGYWDEEEIAGRSESQNWKATLQSMTDGKKEYYEIAQGNPVHKSASP